MSSYFKDDIQRLSHIVYNNTGVEVCVSEIGTVGVLKDFDVVVAASSAAAKDTAAESDDCNKKKAPTTANQTVEDVVDAESHRGDVESTPPAVERRDERRATSKDFSKESNDKPKPPVVEGIDAMTSTARRQPTGRSVTCQEDDPGIKHGSDNLSAAGHCTPHDTPSSRNQRSISHGNSQKHKIGTRVRKYFNGYGWYNGEINAFDKGAGYYKIVYR